MTAIVLLSGDPHHFFSELVKPLSASRGLFSCASFALALLGREMTINGFPLAETPLLVKMESDLVILVTVSVAAEC